MSRVFVTGSTGLLGNNLVRALSAQGHTVRALARSADKARAQLGDVPNAEIVIGDLSNVAGFARQLEGCETLFHTAAYFRDSYKGGNHARELERTNVDGTRALMEAAYAAGIRSMVHTSSVAVLARRSAKTTIDETDTRPLEQADDYYRSKILSERAVEKFLAAHADFNASFVLPGWMVGPGDIGPTSSGQMIQDVVHGKLPGLPPGAFSAVDARDVADAHIAAAERGRRGERYIATGTAIKVSDLIPLVGKLANVRTPTRHVPMTLLFVLAAFQELGARMFGKPALLSMAAVKLMKSEGEDNNAYDLTKSQRELAYSVRPLEKTLADTIAWYRAHGYLKTPASQQPGHSEAHAT